MNGVISMSAQARQTVKTIFQNIDDETLDKLMQTVKIVDYPANTHLCHEGARERTFYVIVNGEVAITRHRIDGQPVLLQKKGANDFFGEIALLTDQPRTADVSTTTGSTMVEMGINEFREVLKIKPEFLDHLMQLMAEYKGNHRRINKLIFTSYAREDQVLVKRLVKDLKNQLGGHQINIWLDQIDIMPGKDWDSAVEEALSTSTAMILIISDKSVKSRSVKDEWNYCLEEGKTIIPILIDPNCKIPFRLRTYHYIDFTQHEGADQYTEGLDRIILTLKEVASQVEKS
jgi:CRP-like cAMP-binding protein